MVSDIPLSHCWPRVETKAVLPRMLFARKRRDEPAPQAEALFLGLTFWNHSPASDFFFCFLHFKQHSPSYTSRTHLAFALCLQLIDLLQNVALRNFFHSIKSGQF